MELKYYLRGLGLGIIVTALIMGFSLSGKQPMTDEEIIAKAKQLGMIEDTVLAAEDTEDAADEQDNMEVIANEQQSTDAEDVSRIEEIKEQADSVGQNPEAEENEENKENEENSENEDSKETEESLAAEEAKTEEEDAEADKVTQADDQKVPDEQQQTSVEENPEVKPDVTETASTEAVDDAIVTSGASTTITISSGDGSYTVSRKLAEAGAVSSAETYDKFLCQNGYDKKIRTGTYVIPADASDEQMARIITGME